MKKRIVVFFATIIVFIIMMLLIVFVFFGKNYETNVEFRGIWKVAVNVSEGSIDIPSNEYMVFEENRIVGYKNGLKNCYIESSYITYEDIIEMPDISKKYHIVVKTEEYISLYLNDNTYITLIKVENEKIIYDNFDSHLINGKWNVKFRPTETSINNEYLEFNNDLVADYQNNSELPEVKGYYEWNGNVIKLPSLKKEMICSFVASNKIILIDTNDGTVWLLMKAED